MKIKFIDLPCELERPLKEMESLLSFTLAEDGRAVCVRKNDCGPKLIIEPNAVTLEYHKIPEFFRACTLLPSRIDQQGIYEEFPAHEDLCMMADCSRNAVLNIPAAKRMMRYLALMGFTSLMLYTEDTYEVPEYPFFGYLRGRFSQEELRELDRYGAMLGIELIPCMQVLAHLETALRWPQFYDIIDTGNILLVGEEKTYAFIEAMIRACRNSFSTKRIHIGMDEAWLLGAGEYRRIHGDHPQSEIFLQHLNRVSRICEKYDFEPIIWSDMFFRSTFNAYYISEGEIPQKVLDSVPEKLSLVYWDYYTKDEKTVRHMFRCHRQFKNPVFFAGGAWKWYSCSPINRYSLLVNDLQLKVAREERLPMVIATAWGNNGNEVSNFAVMSTLQQYAEYCYAKGDDRQWVKDRFAETFGLKFDDFMLLDSPGNLSDTNLEEYNNPLPMNFLYNDPIGGFLDFCVKPSYDEEYAQKAEELAAVPENQFSYLLHTAEALCRLLALKATLSLEIRNAYHAKDRATLSAIIEERIPATIAAVDGYLCAAREEWYHDNKSYGFEVIEVRLGGLKERLRAAQGILQRWLDGSLPQIEQLEEPLLAQEKFALKKWCRSWPATFTVNCLS